MSRDCGFCGGPTHVTLRSRDKTGKSVRACRECAAELAGGEVLQDIFDLAWWKDEAGFHAAHKDEALAKAGREAVAKWKNL